MTRDNIKLVGNGITVYLATRDVKENYNNAITIIKIPSTDTTPATTQMINLNKIEDRFTFTGWLTNGKMNASETYTNGMQKKKALKTMFGLGSVVSVTWEGITYTLGVDKYEIGYSSKDDKEINSGTTTSTTTNKLIQAGQNFNSTVSVGYLVHNTTDDTFAQVSAIDSSTTLSLDSDVMTTGETFAIYAIHDGETVYDVIISGTVGGDMI